MKPGDGEEGWHGSVQGLMAGGTKGRKSGNDGDGWHGLAQGLGAQRRGILAMVGMGGMAWNRGWEHRGKETS